MNGTSNGNGSVELEPVPANRASVRSNEQPEPQGHDLRGDSRKLNTPQKRQGGGSARFVFTVVLVAAVVVGAMLWHRSRTFGKLKSETAEMALPTVETVTPKAGPGETEIVLPGNLTAYTEASIYARVNGYVKAWYTDIGAKVKEGDLMAEIEAPDVDAQMRQSTANLSQAQSNLEIARLNFEREKDLLTKKVVSQQEYDQNRTNMEAQQAAVQAGQASLENLKVQQGFEKITAPFTGVVTRRDTDVGALINAGSSTASSGLELFHVSRTDILRVFIYVPQIYSQLVKLDTPAYLELAENPGVKFEGKVAHVAGAIDPASRTLLTEVQVPNADGRLFPGAFANVHLKLHLTDAPPVVPSNAVIFRSQGTQVAVVDESGTVHLKKVTVGRDFGTSVEITEGLAANERIVVNPADSLADGTKVRLAAK